MAKRQLNRAIRTIQATPDNWVYRRTGDGMAIARRPTVTAAPTAATPPDRRRHRPRARMRPQDR